MGNICAKKNSEKDLVVNSEKITIKKRFNSAVGSVRMSVKRLPKVSFVKKNKNVQKQEEEECKEETLTEEVIEKKEEAQIKCETTNEENEKEVKEEKEKVTIKERFNAAVGSVRTSIKRITKVRTLSNVQKQEEGECKEETVTEEVIEKKEEAQIKCETTNEENKKAVKEEKEKVTIKERFNAAVGSVRTSIKRIPKISILRKDKNVPKEDERESKEETVTAEVSEKKVESSESEVLELNTEVKVDKSDLATIAQDSDCCHDEATEHKEIKSDLNESSDSQCKSEVNEESTEKIECNFECKFKAESEEEIKVDLIVNEESANCDNGEIEIHEELIECKIVKRKTSTTSVTSSDIEGGKIKSSPKSESDSVFESELTENAVTVSIKLSSESDKLEN